MTTETTAWDSYWAENQSANSFEFDYSTEDGPYGKVNQYWQQVFKSFTPQATIVDLAAGNGALSNLYLQCMPTPSCHKWINIDSAKTKEIVKSNKVEYQIANLESLPFNDSSVDHFVSMYGLEYARFQPSLHEIKRCLKEDGKFHFILHHQESIITQQSKITITVYEKLIKVGLFRELSTFSLPESLKRHLLSCLNTTLHACPANEQDDVKIVGQQIFHILQHSQSLSQCIDYLNSLKDQLSLHTIRLQQQIEAANQANDFKQCLLDNGFSGFKIDIMKYENMIMAWQCSYER